MSEPLFDRPDRNDNRRCDYSTFPDQTRPDYPVIAEWVPEGARVLDLGCGNGSSLALIRECKRTRGAGVELSESGVVQSRAKGLNVRPGRIDEPMCDFGDDAFDVAICNITLQMVMFPEVLWREMKRIAPVQIVSFPYFGVIHNRLDALF